MAFVSDYVTSFVDGRVRLRHPALKNREYAEIAVEFLSGMDGVAETRVNPVTGSLLIFYDPEILSRDKLLEIARQAAAFLPEDMPSPERKSLTECCVRTFCGREVTRFVDRALLISLVASLAGAVTGMGAVHRITGAVFAVASLQHVAAHRKALW